MNKTSPGPDTLPLKFLITVSYSKLGEIPVCKNENAQKDGV